MLQDRLYDDLKKAMKSGNDVDKNTIQYVRAEVLRAEKDRGCKLTDADVEGIIFKEKIKRQDALAMFEKAHRQDLMEKTFMELTCLDRYLPKPMLEEELEDELNKIIAEFDGDKTKFGQIMQLAKVKIGSRATGKQISDVLKKLLNL